MKKLFLMLMAIICLFTADLKAEEYDDGIAKKAEFRLELGGSFGSNRDRALLTEIGLGYNFSSNWYIGAVTGYFANYGYCLGGTPGSYVPTMLDLTYRINDTESDQISAFVSVRAGMLWNMTGRDSIDFYSDPKTPKIEYTYQDYFALEFMPGFMWRIKRNVDLRLSLGYCLALPGDDGYSPHLMETQHSFVARIGFGFRGKPKSGTRREVRIHNLEESNRLQRDKEAKRKEENARKMRESEERAAADREARRQEREDAARRRASDHGAIK